MATAPASTTSAHTTASSNLAGTGATSSWASPPSNTPMSGGQWHQGQVSSTSPPHGYSLATDEEKAERPYQYEGYPLFARWMASSHDFFMLRRFSKESARCLLRLQHEIAKRSQTLDEMDQLSMEQPPGFSGLDSFDEDKLEARIKLIEEIEKLLQRYYDLINAFSQVRKTQTARTHHLQNLEHWFDNHPDAVDPHEQHFRDQDDPKENKEKQKDLFAVVMKDRSPLRLLLGRWKWLRLLFPPRDAAHQPKGAATKLTSETALDRLTNAIVLIVGLGLLFGPMWVLHFVSSDTTRLAIITGFVTAFTSLAFSAAGQRPFEVLAATAAYAAVLMVYLQNSNDQHSDA